MGWWFDKLTMREIGDAMPIAEIAEFSSATPPISVILGLDPRTHNLKGIEHPHSFDLLSGGSSGHPRVKPED